jgi:energy-converting hydrogenase Eha subunit B
MLFSWDNGTFNGGVFGNATIGENSTWKYGNFNGGRFQGRVWENGLFSAGEFIGSATFSALVELLLEVLHR